MRMCKRNSRKIWVSTLFEEIEEVDSFGYNTGNNRLNYYDLSQHDINSQPTNGKIVQELFGVDLGFDMVFSIIGRPFDEYSIFYDEKPDDTLDLYNQHDYFVDSIKTNINVTYYALKKRVK